MWRNLVSLHVIDEAVERIRNTSAQSVALTRAGGELSMHATEPSQVALFMGQPLNEPVVRHGPFAMTNQVDIDGAISDFKVGLMGRR